METISIESEAPISLKEMEDALSQRWHVATSNSDTVVVHGSEGRAYLYLEGGQGRPFRLLLDYSDIGLAKSVLEIIADDPDLTVNTDFGTILPGTEFVARIKAERGWNWRTEPSGNS